MNKIKNFLSDWVFVVLAFGCFGTLFLISPATWLPTLIIIFGGAYAAIHSKFRGLFVGLFKDKGFAWIAWPFAIWLAVAVFVSIAHAGESKFHVPSNELRFIFALSILCFTVRARSKQAFYIGLMVGAVASLAWGVYELEFLHVGRAKGTTNNPIHFGNLTALISLLSFTAALLDIEIGSRYRVALLLSAILAALASMCSLTRSSAILILCVVPLVWFPHKDKFHKFTMKAAGVLLIMVVCAIGLSAQVRERMRIHEFTAAFASSEKVDYERLTSDRANMWHAAALLFKANLWVGVGPKGFSKAFENLANEGFVSKTRFHNQPHNDMLYSASMGGIFKLLAYLGLICGPFIYFYRVFRTQTSDGPRLMAIFGMQIVATYFLTGLTNSNFDLQIYSTTYAVLVCVLARLTSFEISEAEPSTPSTPTAPSH